MSRNFFRDRSFQPSSSVPQQVPRTGGGNSVTGVLSGGSCRTVRRHEEVDTSCVVCCRLLKEEGGMAGGGEGRDGEVEERGNEMVWS